MARHLGTFLAVLLCLWTVPLAFAYPTPVDFDGSILRWDIGPNSPAIGYEIVSEDPNTQRRLPELVHDAATLWSSIPTSYFRFTPAAQGELAQVTVRLEYSIDGSAYSAGYAIFDGYEDDKPSHCSIHVDISGGQSIAALSKTILHELGHCVGLGHSLIPEAVMSYSLDKNTYALDIDDVAAVTRLYPAGGTDPSLPPGCATGALRPEHSNSGLIWIFLLTPLLAISRSRASYRWRL